MLLVQFLLSFTLFCISTSLPDTPQRQCLECTGHEVEARNDAEGSVKEDIDKGLGGNVLNRSLCTQPAVLNLGMFPPCANSPRDCNEGF